MILDDGTTYALGDGVVGVVFLRLDNRQIVYTGITRAKKRAVIVGAEKALTAALERKIERDTGIALDGATEAGNKGTQGKK